MALIDPVWAIWFRTLVDAVNAKVHTTPLVAVDTGPTATLAGTGGNGPTTAAQNSWLKVIDPNGVTYYLPAWK